MIEIRERNRKFDKTSGKTWKKTNKTSIQTENMRTVRSGKEQTIEQGSVEKEATQQGKKNRNFMLLVTVLYVSVSHSPHYFFDFSSVCYVFFHLFVLFSKPKNNTR